MFERNLLVLTLGSVAVLLTLALVVWLAREPPVEVRPGGVSTLEEGTRVRVEGLVAAPGPQGSGSSSWFWLEDGDGGRVRVFLTFDPPDVGASDRVRVTGEVGLHRGETEVLVNDPGGLEVLARSRSPLATLSGLLAEPWRYEGTEPRVPVMVVVPPVADAGGEDYWCLLSDPDDPEGVAVVALLGTGIRSDAWEAGAELDLRVIVRYEGSLGLVYLEVLGPA